MQNFNEYISINQINEVYVLNYIWAFMIIIGIVYGAITGNMSEVSNGFLDSSKEAITLCITMLGVISFWSGIMEIGKKGGVVKQMTKMAKQLVIT